MFEHFLYHQPAIVDFTIIWFNRTSPPFRESAILLHAYRRLLESDFDSVLAGMIQAAEEVLRGMGLTVPKGYTQRWRY
jgi:hypothetical protein